MNKMIEYNVGLELYFIIKFMYDNLVIEFVYFCFENLYLLK